MAGTCAAAISAAPLPSPTTSDERTNLDSCCADRSGVLIESPGVALLAMGSRHEANQSHLPPRCRSPMEAFSAFLASLPLGSPPMITLHAPTKAFQIASKFGTKRAAVAV